MNSIPKWQTLISLESFTIYAPNAKDGISFGLGWKTKDSPSPSTFSFTIFTSFPYFDVNSTPTNSPPKNTTFILFK